MNEIINWLKSKLKLKLRVVFLVQYTFIFSSYYNLYLNCRKSSRIKPYVCIIPNVDDRMQGIKIDEVASKIKDTFHIKDCLIDNDGKLLEKLSPDVVFVQTPYDSQRSSAFSVENLSRFAKVCYIPYGIGIADCPQYHYGLDFYSHCWKIFIEAPISLEMCHDYLGEDRFVLLKDKLVVSGSPKIEMIMNYEYNIEETEPLWKLPRTPSVKRIIWAPHWNYEWNISRDGLPRKGYSQFLKYYLFFLEYIRKNPNIDLVLRAHPLTYSEITNRGLLSAEELELFKQEFNALPNARIDDAISDSEAYLNLFYSSDAMITDGISFLTEYPVTGKPLLHTIGTDNPASFNAYGDRIVKAFYQAFSEQDIVYFINHVVVEGVDEMLEQRKKIINEELYIPELGVSPSIRDYIIKELL